MPLFASLPDGCPAWTDTPCRAQGAVPAATGNSSYQQGSLAGNVQLLGSNMYEQCPPWIWQYTAADYAVPGRTTQWRILAAVFQNGVTFTLAGPSFGYGFGLASVSAVGGAALTVTPTAARLATTEVVMLPLINSRNQSASTNISGALVDGTFYIPQVTVSDSSGATPANFASTVNWTLQYRHV